MISAHARSAAWKRLLQGKAQIAGGYGHARGSPTCRRVLESSPLHSVLWTPTVVRGCPENLENDRVL